MIIKLEYATEGSERARKMFTLSHSKDSGIILESVHFEVNGNLLNKSHRGVD